MQCKGMVIMNHRKTNPVQVASPGRVRISRRYYHGPHMAVPYVDKGLLAILNSYRFKLLTSCRTRTMLPFPRMAIPLILSVNLCCNYWYRNKSGQTFQFWNICMGSWQLITLTMCADPCKQISDCDFQKLALCKHT